MVGARRRLLDRRPEDYGTRMLIEADDSYTSGPGFVGRFGGPSHVP